MLGMYMSGGGARGAYQAGAIRGIAEILKEQQASADPFQWYAGMSAGAINTTFCAAGESDLLTTSQSLVQLWENIEPNQVYRTDAFSLGKITAGWMRDLSVGAMFKKRMARELLDASPLRDLLLHNIDFDNIEKKIDAGRLKGVTCCAFNYDEHKVVSFLQSDDSIANWNRHRRYSYKTPINVSHILASSSIPILFSPVEIEGSYYGDGSLRNTAPISPIIHMKCPSFVFIGVRYMGTIKVTKARTYPSVARVAGAILNGLFFDYLEVDLERLDRVNSIVRNHKNGTNNLGVDFVGKFCIHPSRDLGEIAGDYAVGALPRFVEYLLGGLGGKMESSEIASYLLFDSRYTRKLLEIGYEDVLKQKAELVRFWEESCHPVVVRE